MARKHPADRPDRPADPPSRSPIGPLDCKHMGRLLVESSTGGPPHRDHVVHVCPRCGQFGVSGTEQGVRFRVEFALPTRRLVEAAGRYCEYLDEGDEG